MEGLRFKLLIALRRGSHDMGLLADQLYMLIPQVYRELEAMRRDGLVDEVARDSDCYALTKLGLKALEVLDSAQAGPPGWKQGQLW